MAFMVSKERCFAPSSCFMLLSLKSVGERGRAYGRRILWSGSRHTRRREAKAWYRAKGDRYQGASGERGTRKAERHNSPDAPFNGTGEPEALKSGTSGSEGG